jgi:hypothetical protein
MAASDSQHRWRVRMLVLHAVLVFAPCFLFLLLLDTLGFCLVRHIFGIECPGCGMTHAVQAMLAGNPSASFRNHPAGPLMTILLLLLFFYFMFVILLGNRVMIAWTKEVKGYIRVEKMALIGLVAGWLYKLIIT